MDIHPAPIAGGGAAAPPSPRPPLRIEKNTSTASHRRSPHPPCTHAFPVAGGATAAPSAPWAAPGSYLALLEEARQAELAAKQKQQDKGKDRKVKKEKKPKKEKKEKKEKKVGGWGLGHACPGVDFIINAKEALCE